MVLLDTTGPHAGGLALRAAATRDMYAAQLARGTGGYAFGSTPAVGRKTDSPPAVRVAGGERFEAAQGVTRSPGQWLRGKPRSTPAGASAGSGQRVVTTLPRV